MQCIILDPVDFGKVSLWPDFNSNNPPKLLEQMKDDSRIYLYKSGLLHGSGTMFEFISSTIL